MSAPTEPKGYDYSNVTQIALTGGIIFGCKAGSYREFTMGLGKAEVFECESDGRKVVGRSDSVVAMWFSEEVDN